MKIRVKIMLFAFLMCMVFNSTATKKALAADAKGSECVIYVSPHGNDFADGSESNPLQTVHKAADVAKNINLKKPVAVTVIFKEGVYDMREPLLLDVLNSGYPNAPVTFKAEPGAKVVFSAGTELDISGFTDITDTDVLSKLKDGVRKNVKQLDLSPYGFNADDIDVSYGIGDGSNSGSYGNKNILFLNGVSQNIARWPNNGYAKIISAVAGTGGANQGSFVYKEDAPDRWSDAKDILIEGYLGSYFVSDMLRVSSVDVEEKRINLKSKTRYGPKADFDWCAINLIEELDIPGEWFIDKDKMILYFYPPKELDEKTDKLEIAAGRKNMISLSETKHIVFDGITFECNSNDYNNFGAYSAASNSFALGGEAIDMINTEDISIKNCIFRNIGSHAVVLDGENVTIENCDFIHIGWNGVCVKNSGDVKTIRSGKSEIKNNRFFDTMLSCGNNGSGAIACQKVSISGNVLSSITGLKIVNNLISNAPRGGIGLNGVEVYCAYNEIYNIGREAADVGAIYNGRMLSEVGNIMEYNYIHDIGSDKKIAPYGQVGIFWDDAQSGNVARYNIIKPGVMNGTYDLGILSSGAHNEIYGNTIIDSTYPVNATNYYSAYNAAQVKKNNSTWYNTINNEIYYRAPYTVKYPYVSHIYDTIEKDNGFILTNVVIKDNLFVDFEKTRYVAQIMLPRNELVNDGGVLVKEKDYSMFVDPDNQDYRVKNEKKKSIGIPDGVLDENFDLNTIGPDNPGTIKADGEPNVILPKSESAIERRNVELVWNKVEWADEYEYIIAEDKEFKNIAETGVSYSYNSAVPINLKTDTKYYWKVVAKNVSRAYGFKVEGDVGEFITSKYDVLNKEKLESHIASAESFLKTNSEGVKSGEYRLGSFNILKTAVSDAYDALKLEKGIQEDIDTVCEKLAKTQSDMSFYINVGYGSLDTSDAEKWMAVQSKITENISEEDGGLLIWNENDDQASPVCTTDKLPNYEILCFNQKIDDFKGGWCGYAIRNQANNSAFYGQPCYSVVIKEDVIEFQNKGKILQKIRNEGIITAGKWSRIQFGGVNTDTGVKVIFRVDGKTIFEYFDDDIPIYEGGFFQIFPTKGKTLHIKGVETIPTEVITEVDRSTSYDTNSATYEETGSWSDSADGSRVTSENGASAKWTLSGVLNGTYRVYFYCKPGASADSNAEIRLQNYAVDEKVTLNLKDCEEGWYDLGVHKFITAVADKAEIDVLVTSSGTGECFVSKVKIERVIE